MTGRRSEDSSVRKITEREKSNWAVAHAMMSVRPRLNKALRRAYNSHSGDLAGEADGKAVTVAYGEAMSLLACLGSALELLDLPVPALPAGASWWRAER